jgi:hypothetical protein
MAMLAELDEKKWGPKSSLDVFVVSGGVIFSVILWSSRESNVVE